MNCLYSLEINPLLVASLDKISPYSEGCPFTLFVISFAVQKLLSLIRSHLFMSGFISITLEGGGVIENLAVIYTIKCSAYVFL